MKISCLQDNLAKGLSIVGRAVSPRSTLPVLGNVLLAVDNGRLKLSATNLEIVNTHTRQPVRVPINCDTLNPCLLYTSRCV